MSKYKRSNIAGKTLILVFWLVVFIPGCATYTPMQLAQQNILLDLNALVVQANASPLIKAEPINLTNGLSLSEVVTLSLFNSPELKSYRQQYQLAKANAYAQGLLPDPQFSLGVDNPTDTSSNAVTAWTAGLGFDLNSLLLYQAHQNIGERQSQQAQYDLLWQAWQVSQNAQLLLIDCYFAQQKIELTQEYILRLEKRYQHSSGAVEQGDANLADSASDLMPLLDAHSQANIFMHDLNDKSSQLAQLLGVENTIPILAEDLSNPTVLSAPDLHQGLALLEQSRPDLLALQQGYAAQEESVRSAILAQFPALTIGITSAKDTGGLKTQGFNIGISLPLFNANRGNIAIERASRALLSLEYQKRLMDTQSAVVKLWQAKQLFAQQQVVLHEHLASINTLFTRAQLAYQQGDLSGLLFSNIESTWFNKNIEQLDVSQSQLRIESTLRLLLMLPTQQDNKLQPLINNITL